MTRDRQRKPTYADIEALPDGLRGEIIGGELIVSPRPASPHVHTSSTLGGMLVTAFQLGMGGPGGWLIYDEPELSLGVEDGYDPIVPDLAGWRVSTMGERKSRAQYTTVPDWVCEVLSPSSQRIDRVRKLPFYARAGVDHAWIVHPVDRTVEVFERQGTVWKAVQCAEDGDLVRLAPFNAVEIDLSNIWETPADQVTT